MIKDKMFDDLFNVVLSILPCDDENRIDYAELLAEELMERNVVVLPCALGEPIFHIIKNFYGESKIYETPFSLPILENINKTVFLTREEAEAALKEVYICKEELSIMEENKNDPTEI